MTDYTPIAVDYAAIAAGLKALSAAPSKCAICDDTGWYMAHFYMGAVPMPCSACGNPEQKEKPGCLP